MSDDNDWKWAIEVLDDDQRQQANLELSVGYAKERYDDFDKTISSQTFSDAELNKVSAARDPAETAYRLAKSRTSPTPLGKILGGQKATSGSKK